MNSVPLIKGRDFDDSDKEEDDNNCSSTVGVPDSEANQVPSFVKTNYELEAASEIRKLSCIFSDFNKILSRAALSALLIQFVEKSSRDQFSLLSLILMTNSMRIHNVHLKTNQQLLKHKQYQFFSIFTQQKSPIQCSSDFCEMLRELTIGENFESTLNDIDKLARASFQSTLIKFIDSSFHQGIYDQKLIESINKTKDKYSDLLLFDNITRPIFIRFNSESTNNFSVAMAWCLCEIADMFTNMSIDYSLDPAENHQNFLKNLRPEQFSGDNFYWKQKCDSSKTLREQKLSRKSTFNIRTKKVHNFSCDPISRITFCGHCQLIIFGEDAAFCPFCRNCEQSFHLQCSSGSKCSKKSTNSFNANSPQLGSGYDTVNLRPTTPDKQSEILRQDNDSNHDDVMDYNMDRNSVSYDTQSTYSSGQDSNSVSAGYDFSTLPRPDDKNFRSHGIMPGMPELKNLPSDISTFFDADDEYLHLPESYEGDIAIKRFPDFEQLKDLEKKRFHKVAEFDFYIGFVVKHLRVLDIFFTNYFKDKEDLLNSLGADKVKKLIDVFRDLDRSMKSRVNSRTFTDVSATLIQWINKFELPLFESINNLSACVRNRAIWNEIELTPSLPQFNSVFFQRFKMGTRVQYIYTILVIRVPFLMSSIRTTLQHINQQDDTIVSADEARDWETAYQWFLRIPTFQNYVIQPLILALDENKIKSGIQPQMHNLTSYVSNFPRSMFNMFLFEWHPLVSLTLNSQEFLTRMNKPMLILLYANTLVILESSENIQHSENLKYKLKPFKKIKIKMPHNRNSQLAPGLSDSKLSLSVSRQDLQNRVYDNDEWFNPVFILDNIHQSLHGSTLNIIFHDKNKDSFPLRVELGFSSEEAAKHWNYILGLRKNQKETSYFKDHFVNLDSISTCGGQGPGLLPLISQEALNGLLGPTTTRKHLLDLQNQRQIGMGSSINSIESMMTKMRREVCDNRDKSGTVATLMSPIVANNNNDDDQDQLIEAELLGNETGRTRVLVTDVRSTATDMFNQALCQLKSSQSSDSKYKPLVNDGLDNLAELYSILVQVSTIEQEPQSNEDCDSTELPISQNSKSKKLQQALADFNVAIDRFKQDFNCLAIQCTDSDAQLEVTAHQLVNHVISCSSDSDTHS